MPKFTIYKLTDGRHNYIGMTTQALSTRLAQHKKDAKTGGCSVSNQLCQKKAPKDLSAIHRHLKKNPTKFTISTLKVVDGTYETAHRAEEALKNRHYTPLT